MLRPLTVLEAGMGECLLGWQRRWLRGLELKFTVVWGESYLLRWAELWLSVRVRKVALLVER